MGLDMYLKQVELFDGFNFNQIKDMKNQVVFIRDYEENSNILNDFENQYNPEHYWTYVGETEEEKKNRIYNEIKNFVESPQNIIRYNQLKNKFTPELKEKLLNLRFNEVMYWRKANHIHRWFVENVQDGVDNCEYYEVSKEKIKELLDTCQKVVNVVQEWIDKDSKYSGTVKEFIEGENDLTELEFYDEQILHEILPTASGFFFGSTAYDSSYVYDVLDTLEGLNPIIEDDECDNIAYVYVSSW